MDASLDSKTKKIFFKINLVAYYSGLPNFWMEELFTEQFEKFYAKFTYFTTTIIIYFIASELAGFFTQTNLTEKQKSEQLLYGLSHPFMYGFCVLLSVHKQKVKNVMLNLVVELKRVHNDLEVEARMIKKLKSTITALLLFCYLSVILKTCDTIVLVIKTDTTFNTVIPGWPDVDDKSPLANGARVIFYVFWLVFLYRAFSMYILVMSIVICLSHQYINLQSYFSSISNIFGENLCQEEKEKKYEEAFKIGVKLHVDTLSCTEDCRSVCRGVFSGQIIFNIILLVVLLAEILASERNFLNVLAAVLTASAVLISTGCIMWNAGDVTVGASGLSTAMYFSGWHRCTGDSSVRVRRLVLIAMLNAQKPVIMRGLGVIDMSYESYVWIVKMSYTVFSVLY